MQIGQSTFKPSHQKVKTKEFGGARQQIKNMYNADWEKYRLRFLSLNPRCYCCGDKSTVADHLIAHKGDKKLFEKTDNHIPLCFSHHNTITNLFDRRYRPGNPITDKLSWMAKMRLARGLAFKVKVLPTYP